MVILDQGSSGASSSGHNMLGSSANGNHYLNPDYLGPLSSETDSKSSPLAMLAKTCSQIGADSSLGSVSKSGKDGSRGSKPELTRDRNRSPFLKSPKSDDESGGRSSSSSAEIKVTDGKDSKASPIPRSLSSTSSSLSPASNVTGRRASTSPQCLPDGEQRSPKPKEIVRETPVPIVRHGMDVLASSHRDTQRAFASSESCAIRPNAFPAFPPGLLSSNPFLASFLAVSSAAAASTPSVSTSASNSCRDPLCRDPTCPTFFRNHQLLAAASGGLSSLGAYSSLMQREAMISAQRHAAMVAAAAATPPGSGGGPLPFVCNWVSGSDYCGRRFPSSEELLVHLKTHTSGLSTSDPRSFPLLSSNLGPMMSSANRDHLTSARFHPYGRPPGLGVPSPANSPSALASLGLPPGYLNPYASLYPGLFARPPLL